MTGKPFPPHLYQRVIDLYGQSGAIKWIFSGNKLLGDLSPYEVIEKGQSHKVGALLSTIEDMRSRGYDEIIDVEILEEYEDADPYTQMKMRSQGYRPTLRSKQILDA